MTTGQAIRLLAVVWVRLSANNMAKAFHLVEGIRRGPVGEHRLAPTQP